MHVGLYSNFISAHFVCLTSLIESPGVSVWWIVWCWVCSAVRSASCHFLGLYLAESIIEIWVLWPIVWGPWGICESGSRLWCCTAGGRPGSQRAVALSLVLCCRDWNPEPLGHLCLKWDTLSLARLQTWGICDLMSPSDSCLERKWEVDWSELTVNSSTAASINQASLSRPLSYGVAFLEALRGGQFLATLLKVSLSHSGGNAIVEDEFFLWLWQNAAGTSCCFLIYPLCDIKLPLSP